MFALYAVSGQGGPKIAPARLSTFVAATLTSPRTRGLRRALAEVSRRVSGSPHRVHYFHQVDDPYSHLAAQRLEALEARYAIDLVPHLVGPPSDAAAPERARLEAFARKDAADVAPGYGLTFPRRERPPDAAEVHLAACALADAIASRRFAEAAAPVGAALWRGEPIPGGAADAAAAQAAVEAGNALRRRLGHYLGAMFHYGGEWYWGVDRLRHLERRLTGLGLRRPGSGEGPLVARPETGDLRSAPQNSRVGERLGLELYLSLRSPYSYIAIERTLELARRLSVDLALRPVLPMVMRGLPVPREKRLYILLDAKREAESAGITFGRVCDPVGRPVERCFSLWRWSRERGREAELLLSFSRAVFAEGVDAATDAGMRRVAEAAGLPWSEARERLDRDDGWRDALEGNRQALLAMGLWGVPSFRILGRSGESDFCTWGQDRLWRVETEIRSRLCAPVAGREGTAAD